MIAYVSMVKDEEDIIYQNLNHYKNLGIENYYIVDHNSEDKTLDLIMQFASENQNFKVEIYQETDIRYYQSKIITHMCDIAYEDGNKWVLPVDADEFLQSEDNITLFDELSKIEKPFGFVNIEWLLYHPINNNKKSGYCEEYYDIQHKKVLVKWTPGMTVVQGNHLVTDGNGKIFNPEFTLSSQLYYAHFKYRSKEQVRKKIINFGKAYEPIQDYLYHGESITNWKRYQKYGEGFIDMYWDIHCKKNVDDLIYLPVKSKLDDHV